MLFVSGIESRAQNLPEVRGNEQNIPFLPKGSEGGWEVQNADGSPDGMNRPEVFASLGKPQMFRQPCPDLDRKSVV